MKDIHTPLKIALSFPTARRGAGDKVSVAVATVILMNAQVHNHDLIALAGVLKGSTVCGLDTQRLVRTEHASRTSLGLGPDMNTLVAFNPFNSQTG